MGFRAGGASLRFQNRVAGRRRTGVFYTLFGCSRDSCHSHHWSMSFTWGALAFSSSISHSHALWPRHHQHHQKYPPETRRSHRSVNPSRWPHTPKRKPHSKKPAVFNVFSTFSWALDRRQKILCLDVSQGEGPWVVARNR